VKDLATMDDYGALTEPATLHIERLLPGPIERVWAYLTEGDLRRRWLASGDMPLTISSRLRTAAKLTRMPATTSPAIEIRSRR
jgi:uncharacterized protein YndB with AHSA1/START domain